MEAENSNEGDRVSVTTKRKYNIVIFGATGFTGRYLIQETVNFLKVADESEQFTWAVAARSKDKLGKILAEISKNTGEDLSSVDSLIADVADYESLRTMARQCDIILNCVGPYILWGEVVVKACLAERTHHLDLSGEVQYLENIQLLYDKVAKEKNVYIVAPCGIDSIPADLGTTYLKQQFGGDLNSVEVYLEASAGGGRTSFNVGSFHSAIRSLSKLKELKILDNQVYAGQIPVSKYKLSRRLLHKSQVSKGWALPNPFPDERVVENSQRYFHHEENQTPVQMKSYFILPSLFYAFLFMIASFFVMIMAQFKCGRYFLLKYPEYFTLGYVSKDGPSPAEMERCKFTFTLVGQGWDESLTEATDQHPTPPNKTKTLVVKGTNPGYRATNILFLHSALTILKESDKLPSSGGVYTPGIAFARTSLVDRLNRYGRGEDGVKFSFE